MTPAARSEASGDSSRWSLATWALPALVLIAFGGSLAWFAYDEYNQTIEREFRALESNARIAEAQVSGLLRNLEQLLHSIAEEQSVLTRDERARYDELLSRRKARFPEIRSLAVTSAQGQVEFSATPLLKGFDSSQRDYFVAHLAAPLQPNFYSSRPFKTTSGNDMSIAFSVAIRDRDKRFKGVVVSGLDPRYFESVLQQIRPPGRNSTATLWNDHGDLIYRLPDPERYRAMSIATSTIFKEHVSAGATLTRHIGISAADGLKRVFAITGVGSSGLNVSASSLYDDVVVDWRRNLVLRSLLFALTATVTLLLTWLVQRRRREHDRDAAVLALQSRRTLALLELPQDAERMGEKDFMQHGQELAENLTRSEVSFIHFVNNDENTIELVTWSRRTLEHYCKAIHDKHYPVSQAGIWAEALRQRAPLIFNDYATAPNRRGLPAGHAELKRLISVPVIENGVVVMLAGVGNKRAPYTDLDAESVQLVGNAIWRIVQRRRAIDELSAVRRELEQTMNSMGEGVQRIDLDGNITFQNRASARMLGWNQDEAVGFPSHPTMHHTRADGAPYPAPECPIYATLRDGVSRHIRDEVFWRKDGSCFPVDYMTAPMRGEQDEITGVVVTFRDLTEIKHAEELHRRLEAQLRESQKMEAVGILAGGIAHDFNNILGIILGNVSLARQEMPGNPPEALMCMAEVDKAATRAKKLVQQILAFSRKQTPLMELQPLRPLLEESVELVSAAIPAGVSIVPSYAADPVHVRCDKNQIEQVVMNLCINSWHAMKGDAGRIEIGLANKFIDETAVSAYPGLRPGRYACVTVRDDGCGMDETTRAHIFEPFFTTKGVGAGTGLGLSVVHGIVLTHQGAITVESSPGNGSTFAIFLPIVEYLPENPLQDDLATG